MSQSRQLTILQLNDSHAYFELHPEVFWQGGEEKFQMVGGYARIATLFNDIQIKSPGGVLTLDNGDTFHGTYAAIQSKGEALVPILNALGLDAMTAHWEFAYGPAEFQKATHKLDYPVLAINCYERDTDTLIFSPGQILERNDIQIGIIGVASNIVDKTMPPRFSEGVYFTLGNKELHEYVTHLREKEHVDLVIVLSHLGYPHEIKLAQEVDGIDILLSSHTHNRLYQPIVVNGAIIIQSGCHGSFVGRLDLEVRDNRVQKFTHQLITIEESIKPNPAVEDMIDKALGPHRSMLGEVVGKTKIPLTRIRVLESTMDNLLLQALLDISGAEVAFSNGWRFGAPILPGDVTMNDLWNMIPENPRISVSQITGHDLWQMMEESLENTFSRDPWRQMGGYLQRCLGLNIYFKIENPFRKRIQEFFIGGKPLEPSKTYRAAFFSEWGIPPRFGTNRRELDVKAVDSLIGYFAVHSPVSAESQQSLVPI